MLSVTLSQVTYEIKRKAVSNKWINIVLQFFAATISRFATNYNERTLEEPLTALFLYHLFI